MNAVKRNHVTIKGSGKQPIVFSHGFGCDQNMWRSLAPRFESTHRVILFDHVGAGGSDEKAYSHERHGTLQGYADDFLEICRELDLKDVIFVGHSVSAMIGVLAAIREPGRFSRLVLIGPSPCYAIDGEYKGGFRREDLEAMLQAADQDYLGWARSMGPAIMGNPERPELAQELTNSFCRTHSEIAKHFAKVVFLSDNRADLPHLSVPSLILQCSQDIVAPEFVGRYLHEKLQGSELHLLRAIGHCPHVSEPEETFEAIRAYLSRSVSRKAA